MKLLAIVGGDLLQYNLGPTEKKKLLCMYTLRGIKQDAALTYCVLKRSNDCDCMRLPPSFFAKIVENVP